MKRYRKNQIIRIISGNRTIIISAIVLFIGILILVLGFQFGTFTQRFFLIPICGIMIIIALIFLLPKTPWIAPWISLWINKEKIEQEIEIFKKVDNKLGLALSLIAMGILYGAAGKKLVELDYFMQSMEIFIEIKKDEGMAIICQPIGSIYEKYEDFSEAKHYYELGLDLSKKIQDWSLVYDYNILLGEFYEKQGMNEKAESYYTEADQVKNLKKRLLKAFMENVEERFKET